MQDIVFKKIFLAMELARGVHFGNVYYIHIACKKCTSRIFLWTIAKAVSQLEIIAGLFEIIAEHYGKNAQCS